MKSVGIDIIEIERIRRAVERFGEIFLQRVFTGKELAYCRLPSGRWKYASLAARFAAKEAFYKAAFPRVKRFIGWHECEIASSPERIPEIHLSAGLQQELSGAQVTLSLSHSRKYAVAVVIIEG